MVALKVCSLQCSIFQGGEKNVLNFIIRFWKICWQEPGYRLGKFCALLGVWKVDFQGRDTEKLIFSLFALCAQ